LLGGVVLTGGEPTLRSELPEIISRFKSTLLAVKLDTNGTRPEALAFLLADEATRPDYIALDLKLAPDRYANWLREPRRMGRTKPCAAIVKSAALSLLLMDRA
jgi:pyruvate formate lyase activating enzyme